MIKRKYFKKLFMIYFAIMLVYGFILTIFFVAHSTTTSNRQQEYNNRIQTDQITKYLDQRLWSLDKYSDTLLQDKDFADYVLIDGDYYIYTKLYNKLSNDMAVFTDIGARIGVTKWVDDFVITNKYTMDVEAFVEEMAFTQEMTQALEAFYYDEDRDRDNLLLLDDTYQQLHIVKKIKSGKSAYALIVLTVDTGFLRYKMVNNAFELWVGDQVPEPADNWMSVRTSTVFDNLHYKVIHDETNFSDSLGLLISGFLTMIVMLTIGYFVSLMLAKRLYQPIGKVVSSFGDTEEAMDEFAYIQSKAETIVEANESLKETLKEKRIDLKTKFLRDVIYGLADKDYGKIGMSEYQLQWLDGRTEVAIIELDEMDSLRTGYSSQTRTKMRGILYTIMVNALDMALEHYVLVELIHNTYAVIVGDKGVKGKQGDLFAKPILEQVLKAVEANEEVSIRMALGSVANHLEEICSSYDSAKAIMDFRTSYDQRALVTVNEQEDLESTGKYYYTLEQERELYHATTTGVSEKIDVIFQRIIKNNFSDRILSSKEELNLMMSLTTTYRRVEQKVDFDIENKKTFGLEDKLGDGNSGVEMVNAFKDQFKAVAQKVKDMAATSDTEMSERMVAYIHHNYHEDISLEEAATSLNISAGYFCTVFKKSTGSNFKTYLNKYRVEMAKNIIKEEPTIKVKDLTLRVGYTNVNSFIRMFKKHEGVSPGEYAKRSF